MKLLEGKSALVTGGGRGIGRAVALDFAKNGANVAIAARSREELDQTVIDIEKHGVKGLAIPADLSSVEGVNACGDTFLDNFSVCDILVNNAGTSQYCSVTDYPVEDFMYLFNLNVMSYFLMTKRMLPGMLEQKSGKIIMTSSGNGNFVFAAKKVSYSASKAAISAMAKCLDSEVGKDNIHVNVICPGPIETQLLEENRQWGAMFPKADPPEAISPIYLFLASNLVKRPYKGKVIDQYSLAELLSILKEQIKSPNFNIKELLKSIKEKLSKQTYTLLRKNQELVDFMLKYE
ncbi:MAG: SDR family oxidoreductase [Promethearchaeota archaeon]|nr:MAG: SDR family oxidoreductase [Candidatus Lokiarchaeota archaeon]